MASAIDVIIHQSRLRDGSRRIVAVTEVVGMEGEVVTTQDLFSFDYRRGLGPDGRHLGSLQPNGLRPRFTDRLADAGVSVPTHWFAPHTRSA